MESRVKVYPSHSRNMTANLPSLEASNRTSRFHSFRQLPFEVRVLIWRYAFPEPNTIEIRLEKDARNSMITGGTVWYPTSRKKIPALLSVCYESRAEMLKTYKKLVGTKEKRIAYVDWARDAIGFEGPQVIYRDLQIFMWLASPRVQSSIRNLAIDRIGVEHCPWSYDLPSLLIDALHRLPNLKKVFIYNFRNFEVRNMEFTGDTAPFVVSGTRAQNQWSICEVRHCFAATKKGEDKDWRAANLMIEYTTEKQK